MSTALQIHDSHTPTQRRVVALIRVSSLAQSNDTRGGVPRQRAVIEQTVKNKGLDCLRVYELADVSGTDVIRNPTVIEILQLVSSRVVTGLVVADLDRLFRPSEPTDYAILQVFKDTGAIIYSGDTEYNLQSKDSALFANIRSAISGFELQLMRERQEGAKEAKRLAGKCATPLHTLPLGVSYNHKTELWSFNERVATVVELFRLVDEEGIYNYQELQRRTGVQSRTAFYLLRNQIYTGWRVISERRGAKRVSKSGKTYREKVARKAEDVIRTKVLDAVVSTERFNRVQKLLSDAHAKHRAAWQKYDAFNFLTGIGFCAYCGERIYGSSGKSRTRPRHGYYLCKRNQYLFKRRMGGCKQKTLRQQETDDMVEQFSIKVLTDPVTLQRIIEQNIDRSRAVISHFPADTGGAAIKRKLARLLEAYENGVLELDEYRTRRDALRYQLDEIERRVTKPDEEPVTGIKEIARKVVRGAFRLKRVSDLATRHEIIHSLLAELHVKDDAIVAFRLRLVDTNSSPAAELIFLQSPFSVCKPVSAVPAGFRLCSCCGETKTEAEFYASEPGKPRKNQCRRCLSQKAHAAYLQRRATKLSRSAEEPRS